MLCDEDTRVKQTETSIPAILPLQSRSTVEGGLLAGKFCGCDGKVLYGAKLEAEREMYMELDLHDFSHKRHLSYDVLEGKPFTFTKVEARIRNQINLVNIFVESGGKFWA